MSSDAGRVIGSYRVHEEIGAGGSGRVYRATGPDGGDVALKLLDANLLADADAVYRFGRELRIAQKLVHANLVRVLDSGQAERTPYLVMELVRGPSIEQVLADRRRLPWPEAVPVLAGIAAGLSALHASGVIHRDVKPSNVLIAPDGTARLTDFGLARAIDSTHITQAGAFIGTLRYMAPEIVAGDPPETAADLWSFGFVAYQLITGRWPFEAEDTTAWLQVLLNAPIVPMTDVPPELAQLVMRMLDRTPARRPTATEVQAALIALPKPAPVEQVEPGAHPESGGKSTAPRSKPSRPARSQPRSPRNRTIVGPAVFLVAAMMLTLLGVWLSVRRHTLPEPELHSVSAPPPPPPFDADGVRAILADIEVRYYQRVDLRTELMERIQPVVRNYVLGRKVLKSIAAGDRDDYQRLSALASQLDSRYPDLEAIPLPALVLTARVKIDLMRTWCGLDNCTNLDRTLARVENTDPGFEGGVKVISVLDQVPFAADGIPHLIRTVDLIELVLRRLCAAPADAGPDLVDYLLDVRGASYFYTFRSFPGDSRERIERRIATLRKSATSQPTECGRALSRVVLALWDHGSGRPGKRKPADDEVHKALDALVQAPACLSNAREIRSTLEMRIFSAAH